VGAARQLHQHAAGIVAVCRLAQGDAIDLTERLAKSRRVRQSIIRHAFRYFMGRNECLSDSKTLIDAEKSYDESGGSFDAVIISLLTSDSFIFRKPATN
jgi:hypothetical protein